MDSIDDKLKNLVDKLDGLSNTLGTLLSAYSGFNIKCQSYDSLDLDSYTWKKSVQGKVLAQFSNYVPYSTASADELLAEIKKAGRESTADLIMLTRIESTLAFILGTLTMLVDLRDGNFELVD